MEMSSGWDSGLFSTNTAEFDRALRRLRREKPVGVSDAAVIRELAERLKDQPGIPRREFDRRVRLTISAITRNDPPALQAIAGHLRENSPEVLNALRILLPAELRHVTVVPRVASPHQVNPAPAAPPPPTPPSNPIVDTLSPPESSPFCAVALIGTTEEHVRNEALLRDNGLHPLRLTSLDPLWEMAPTGLCGFVVGGSVWGQVTAPDHRRVTRCISEYSTFLFSRICVRGLSEEVARDFTQEAIGARYGPLDGRMFCHGQDCELTHTDISALLAAARLLETAATADFFPLGLSEPDAGLLRIIAEQRRCPRRPETSRRLGIRELPGGRSGAQVFLVHDNGSQPFVAKMGNAEQLTIEISRYRDWIANWGPGVTEPTFHAHCGRAALSYSLQAEPDNHGCPAPTLTERLDVLRSAEWTRPIETCNEYADDIYMAVERAANRLVQLNSRTAGSDSPIDEFWLHWPIRDLASKGVDFKVVDSNWDCIDLWELVQRAVSSLEPNLGRGVVHGDIHGRNILLLDRIPAFIDFAWSGPGHPLIDLVRLDAAVRTSAMRMLLDKRSMRDLVEAIYVEEADAVSLLNRHPIVAASPLARLALRTSIKVRDAARSVCQEHGLRFSEFYAMQCVVSAHLLANQHPGSGIERLLLSVLGSRFLSGLD